MKRYLILSGDRTTANGTVQATPTTIQLSGQDVAHEGDSVSCQACNTTGKIQCDGPRQMMRGGRAKSDSGISGTAGA
ncbi:PAAR domain-containing protein [Paraburkholderia heleia]|uniref:PAAR domain-containing protein n=1 Tax=Paraburkholderia heleia TaxID=634127 RepID=UPI0038990C14